MRHIKKNLPNNSKCAVVKMLTPFLHTQKFLPPKSPQRCKLSSVHTWARGRFHTPARHSCTIDRTFYSTSWNQKLPRLHCSRWASCISVSSSTLSARPESPRWESCSWGCSLKNCPPLQAKGWGYNCCQMQRNQMLDRTWNRASFPVGCLFRLRS